MWDYFIQIREPRLLHVDIFIYCVVSYLFLALNPKEYEWI